VHLHRRLAGNAERLAAGGWWLVAGGENPQPWTDPQEHVGQPGDVAHDVLAVVEDQQQAALGEVLDQ
jgi:hypothetical protein